MDVIRCAGFGLSTLCCALGCLFVFCLFLFFVAIFSLRLLFFYNITLLNRVLSYQLNRAKPPFIKINSIKDSKSFLRLKNEASVEVL